jgi:hypothetical protein
MFIGGDGLGNSDIAAKSPSFKSNVDTGSVDPGVVYGVLVDGVYPEMLLRVESAIVPSGCTS